jgi:hypothetical protein
MEQDLEIVKDLLSGLDTDIKHIADIASSYKGQELIEDKRVDQLGSMTATEFYNCYTQVIKDLKSIKRALKPLERRLVAAKGESKSIYTIFDWFVLKPLWVKCGLL